MFVQYASFIKVCVIHIVEIRKDNCIYKNYITDLSFCKSLITPRPWAQNKDGRWILDLNKR